MGVRNLCALHQSECHGNPSRPGARMHKGWGLGADKWGWVDFDALCRQAKGKLYYPREDVPPPTPERHMMFLIYCLVRGAWEDARNGRPVKERFQFAGIFTVPDREASADDDDPMRWESRARRFVTLGFVRAAVGQTCVPWKEPEGSGRKFQRPLTEHFGIVTHVTTP